MKKSLVLILGCYLLGGSLAWASCGGEGGCGGDNCDYNQTTCQCTDPICNKPMYSNCISRGYCCEAFGNIGAR